MRLIGPQRAADPEEGVVVQVLNRTTVQYLGTNRSTQVEVDFGTTVGVFGSTLTHWDNGARISEAERGALLRQIEQALQLMGAQVEIVA